jgi:hypothetical protein
MDLQEILGGGMNRDRCKALVNVVMKLQGP